MTFPASRALAAAALALALGACSDASTAPTAARIAGADAPGRSESTNPALIPNAVRYRDAGGKPAHGRAGSATLDALALLGRDGTTALELRAGQVDGAAGAFVTHAQVKRIGLEGTTGFATNHHAGLDAPIPLPGLGRGSPLRVQAHVRGADPHRTGVVTVTETVKLRPDLSVTLSAPQGVHPGTPVNITAVVAEENGDVGASADCELRVDGVRVDQSPDVWVDAGDAVSCTFTHTFPAAGTYTVEVRAAATRPADWDDANNAATASVAVTERTPAIESNAYVEQTVGFERQASVNRWADATGHGEDTYESRRDRALQIGTMSGYMPTRISGPVRIDVSQSSGGATLHAARWTAGTGADWCTSVKEGGVSFYGCSKSYYGGLWEETAFTYERYAGTVTYHSYAHTRMWMDGAEQEYGYTFNQSFVYGSGTLSPLGSEYRFDVRITAVDGTEYVARSIVPLTTRVDEGGFPQACSREELGGGGFREYCNLSEHRYVVTSGFGQ
ncbi:PKD domain-containing protein [Longimicrobium sp.]|uniref:PKD domain-containing protein n=1 Tax=Longimicrobium sp. TaxID=2029185 RepID=UPI003B3A3519